MPDFRVLIAGVGIAGLTLAQGLRRQGVECAVYEREPLETWRTGYLLNLDVEGDRGLAACLPPAMYELFVRASGETMAEHDFSVVVDTAGNRLTSMKHVGAEEIERRASVYDGFDRRITPQSTRRAIA